MVNKIRQEWSNHAVLQKRLRILTSEKGVTQKAVAIAIKADQRTLGHYYTGTVIPTANIIVRLADYFDVTTDYLLGQDNYKKCEHVERYEEIQKIKVELEERSKEDLMKIQELEEALARSENSKKVMEDVIVDYQKRAA